MTEWQQRVIDEQAEVDHRLMSLNIFLDSRKDLLSANDLHLLQRQALAMQEYRSILGMRILRFEG